MKKLLSAFLCLTLIFSLSVPAFAANSNYGTSAVTSLSFDEETTIDALRNQCSSLSPEAKAIFLQAISNDPELAAYYKQYIDPTFSRSRPTNFARAASSNPLNQLEKNLKALSLPTAVVVSLVAVGSGFIAAMADGPLITVAGASLIMGLNWIVVSPQFPNIVSAFKKSFADSVSVITDVFDSLKAEAKATSSAKKKAEDAAKDVSNTVKEKGSSDTVDLDQFKDKNGKTPKDKSSGKFTSQKDSRYTIEKDTAGHTGYDGTPKEWKLFRSGKRVASLNGNGKIVGN